MAPQVTIYFHKLPASAQGESGCHMTFTFGHPSVELEVPNDALLIRQFVQSLNGSAFTWYTQLKLGSIHTRDGLQSVFLAQFGSSKRKVSIIDLCDARQKPNESVNEFITRWRHLNLQCSEKLTKQFVVQMCSNNLLPWIATFLGSVEPQS